MLGHQPIGSRPVSDINQSPLVALATTDGQDFTDTTPDLDFTGTDLETNDIRYRVQVSDNANFQSNAVVDSYADANQDQTARVGAEDVGQYPRHYVTFDSGAGGTLNRVALLLNKTGTPTGNAVVKIYAHSGTYGSTGVPTGAALATSDNLDVSTLTGTLTKTWLAFSGANRIALTAGTKYVAAIEYGGGDASNRVNIGTDGSSPSHGGNSGDYIASVWTADATVDTCFEVEVAGFLVDATSGTDAGFANTVTGGDTDPFNSGELMRYTLQTTLTVGATYYWRVQGFDPTGSGFFGPWSDARTFDIISGGGGPFTVNLSGTVTPAGTIAKQTGLAKSGSITVGGVLRKTVSRLLAGAATAVGSLRKQDNKSLTGSTTASGALTQTRTIVRAYSGSATPSGTVRKGAQVTKTGTITASGAVAQLLQKVMSGSTAPAGTLAAVRSILRSFAGSTAPSGVARKQANKSAAGISAASGSMLKRADKSLAGSTTPSGTLTRILLFVLSVAGTLTPSGVLRKDIGKAASASIAAAGGLAKRVDKAFAGATAAAGTLLTSLAFFLSVAGSVAPVGDLRRSVSKFTTGSVAALGTLRKTISRFLGGTITAIGDFIGGFFGTAPVVDGIGRVYAVTDASGRTYRSTQTTVTLSVVGSAAGSGAETVIGTGNVRPVTAGRGRTYTV